MQSVIIMKKRSISHSKRTTTTTISNRRVTCHQKDRRAIVEMTISYKRRQVRFLRSNFPQGLTTLTKSLLTTLELPIRAPSLIVVIEKIITESPQSRSRKHKQKLSSSGYQPLGLRKVIKRKNWQIFLNLISHTCLCSMRSCCKALISKSKNFWLGTRSLSKLTYLMSLQRLRTSNPYRSFR